MTETNKKCCHCGFPVHPREPGIRHYGFHVAHSENRCYQLLRDRLAQIERQVRELADEMDQHQKEMRQRPVDVYREGRGDATDYFESRLRAIVDTGEKG